MSPVPDHYRGVWIRKILQTPKLRDATTFVCWLQTSAWHADLRIPESARHGGVPTVQMLSSQQGFCGVTEVTHEAPGEVCTWNRRMDFQPPRAGVDAGVMVFETPERVIETGVHATYLEVWERLPGSTGRTIVLGGLDSTGADTRERVLAAGRYLMHVRPRTVAWPQGLEGGLSLAGVVARHPAIAQELLDFEISVGKLDAGCWTIEHSTLPEREGRSLPCVLQRDGKSEAIIKGCFSSTAWHIIEWTCRDATL
jgi:hypothetical protein